MNVTKSQLSRLNALYAEVRLIENEIIKITQMLDDCVLSDTVQSSGTSYPFVKHTIIISGNDFSDKKTSELSQRLEQMRNELSHKREQCLKEYDALMDYIYGIDDSLIRSIFICKYINRESWTKIAMSVGGNNTPDGIRMIHDRYLKNH